MVCSISTRNIRYEWPQLRLPIYLIVDDPTPCLNMPFYEQYFEPHVRDIPNAFTAAWADAVEEFGVRGKFSVIPIPAGIGRIDRPLPDVRPVDQAEFLDIVRERVSPRMDICIEFLTHFLVWDIQSERPGEYMEKIMGHFTNQDHLTEYFAYGLRILDGLGLQPTGATSPGSACREIEGVYQSAIHDALLEVRRLPIAWYFLHVDALSPIVTPRIMSLNAQRGEACVSMVSMKSDAMSPTQRGEPSKLDILITADGQAGRLVDLFRNGSSISFHTHWQSLFSEGRWTGLQDIRTVFQRIREHFKDDVLWMKCSELAQTVAAQAVTRATVEESLDGIEVHLSSTISCQDFTVSVKCAREIRVVQADGRTLKRLPDDASHLQPSTWKRDGDRIFWCSDLPLGAAVIRLE